MVIVFAWALSLKAVRKQIYSILFLLGAGAFIVNIECHQASFMAHDVGNGGAGYSGTKEEGDYHCPNAVEYMTTAKALCCFQPTKCLAVWVRPNPVLVT